MAICDGSQCRGQVSFLAVDAAANGLGVALESNTLARRSNLLCSTVRHIVSPECRILPIRV
ncbi:hypothetical protein E0H54_02365 [Rhizobium leguminosarum bv. viciae]|nr:hypothetical protein E0H54_02365 [Rhizobium leguminosarum bv. viciae]